MSRTYSLAEAAEIVGAPSKRWLIQQLRSGRFPGRKIGRHWRMTEQDIADTLELCRNECRAESNVLPLVGLTPRSRRRVSNL
jgi:Helix-turn-helix domain